MEDYKRRLLKDLPFGNLAKGTVIFKGGRGHCGRYSISRGKAYYSTGGSSDNGITVFNENEEDIIDTIWDNANWFEVANIKYIDIIPSTTNILLRFNGSIDRDDAELFAEGVKYLLTEIEKHKKYAWSKFINIAYKIKNN